MIRELLGASRPGEVKVVALTTEAVQDGPLGLAQREWTKFLQDPSKHPLHLASIVCSSGYIMALAVALTGECLGSMSCRRFPCRSCLPAKTSNPCFADAVFSDVMLRLSGCGSGDVTDRATVRRLWHRRPVRDTSPLCQCACLGSPKEAQDGGDHRIDSGHWEGDTHDALFFPHKIGRHEPSVIFAIQAMAREFLLAGDHVIITSRSEKTAALAVKELRQLVGGDCVVYGVSCDVASQSSVARLASMARSLFGHVDVWINNAAYSGSFKSFTDFSDQQMGEVVRTNLLGSLYCTKAAFQAMKAQSGGGHIFNMDGAGADGSPTPNYAAYGSTKAAIGHLMKR